MARIKVEEIRRIAEERGLDPAKISRRADLGYTTVYSIWDGSTKNPGLQTLAAIARVLGVRTIDLIEDEEEAAAATNKRRLDLVAA